MDQSAVVPLDSILAHCDVLSPSEYDETVGDGARPRWTFLQPGVVEKVLCDTAFKDGLHFQLNWAKHAAAATTTSLRAPDASKDAWNLSLKGLKAGKKSQEKEDRSDGPRKKVRRIADEQKRKEKRRTGSSTLVSDDEESEEEASGSGSDVYERGGSSSEEIDEEGVDEAASDDDTPIADSDNGEDVVDFSPSKKRKRTAPVPRTPTKRRQTKAVITPASKKALAARRNSMGGGRKKKIRVAAPSAVSYNETDRAALSKLPKNAHLRAMHLLHVAARPDALPGRDGEFNDVLATTLSVLEEGSGGCICES